MSTYVQQSSASDRHEAARKALAEFDSLRLATGTESNLAEALRALITPPVVGESEEQLAHRIVDANLPDRLMHWDDKEVLTVALQSIRAGIQQAHETWDSDETGLDTEAALRFLGIDYSEATADDGEPSFLIAEQHVSRGY